MESLPWCGGCGGRVAVSDLVLAGRIVPLSSESAVSGIPHILIRMSDGGDHLGVPKPASPYTTGGGGTVLEHRYGAVLLTSLLTGNPITNLGDNVVPMRIAFQASAFSPVDDIVVAGRLPDGQERRISIGVRRNPSLIVSEKPTVKLVGTYLAIVHDHWLEVQSGRWRLGLAVVSPNIPAQQVGFLAEIARAVPDEATFRTEVARPARTTQQVRGRLEQMDKIVTTAAAHIGLNTDTVSVGELTWRLLTGLWPVEIRVEGNDQTDRSDAVGRLRPVTRAGTLEVADTLFTRVAELVGAYAPAAATVTEAMLRRDLTGIRLHRSSTWPHGWAVLDDLARRLRDHTPADLAGPDGSLEIDRVQARDALRGALAGTGATGGVLVVCGEPDVGKSALALRVVEELQGDGAGVAALSLRDLPNPTMALESVLSGGLTEVLAGAPVDDVRLLVVDGAEAVLEGREDLLLDLAAAGLRAGLGVAAVARSDAAPAVRECLALAYRTARPAGPTPEPRTHEVSPLDTTETARVATTFPALARLASDARSAWVLTRPGLIELLLRDGAARALPTGPLAEADVFAAIWARLVRRGETTPVGGPTPDARDHALVALARRALLPYSHVESAAALSALPSLRSDGLLRPANVWALDDEFGSDLVRDLAVARLLLTAGWPPITAAGAPRWAVRATRLACQARLMRDEAKVAVEFGEQRQVFDQLAADRGERWAELPLEALFTLARAKEALTAVWSMLIADGRRGLGVLLRLALTRYCQHGVGDPVVLAPLVELAYCGDLPDARERYPRELGKQIQELVLAWLRGLALTGAGPTALRAVVRDTALATNPTGRDEFAVELMGLLGPDQDASAEGFLRGLAAEGGLQLAPVVESAPAVAALANANVDLLILLTEAYYIGVPPTPGHGRLRVGRSRWPGEEGIRPHLRGSYPWAAWWRGPFFTLLRVAPAKAIPLIQRLLNQAARRWVGRLGHYMETDPRHEPSGVELELSEGTRQWCVGDGGVWLWYRGSGSARSVAPCTSALLALERYADYLVDEIRAPLDRVVALLLDGCESLAMPALVVGLLVRHIEVAGPVLDSWLAQPAVWELEFGRRTLEGSMHIQGPDEDDLHGRRRRSYTFHDVAQRLVIAALLQGDEDRVAALREVGQELLRRAHRHAGPDSEEADLPDVAGWASNLDAANYRVVPGNAGPEIEYQPPADVVAGLAEVNADLARGQQVTRLIMTYGTREDRAGPWDRIVDDLALARTLVIDPPDSGLSAPDAVSAVAAAALVGHVRRQVMVDGEDIRWAADILLPAALLPHSGGLPQASMVNPGAADRSAAIGLPTLLLPAFSAANLDREAIEVGLVSCATSGANEVRRALAVGLAPVWTAPCDTDSTTGPCRHAIAWATVEAGLRDCRLGEWDRSGQRRGIAPLTGPLLDELPQVDTDRLLIDRMSGPIIACADAASTTSCVSDLAVQMLDMVLATHRRGAIHWSVQGYGPDDDEDHRRVAAVLLSAAAHGDPAVLVGHLQAYAGTPSALTKLLYDFNVLYTDRSDLRPSLPATWPLIMQTVLDAISITDAADADWTNVLAYLIPSPTAAVADSHPDTTVATARAEWIDPNTLQALIERWTPLARGKPDAIDALIGLARTAPLSWQTTTGLRWTSALVDGDYRPIASRSWHLAGWLAELRSSGHLTPGDATVLHRILDGLVAAGDRRAAKLQLSAE